MTVRSANSQLRSKLAKAQARIDAWVENSNSWQADARKARQIIERLVEECGSERSAEESYSAKHAWEAASAYLDGAD